MGVDIKGSFHLDTSSVKEQASNIAEIAANSGISLKCGGNVLTINSGGIHFKTPNYVENSGNSGLIANDVVREDDIINVRISNIENTYITKVVNKDVIVEADTSLSEGKSITARLLILDKEGKELAREEKSTSVKNSKISQNFNTDKIIKENNIILEDIYEVEGEIEC